MTKTRSEDISETAAALGRGGEFSRLTAALASIDEETQYEETRLQLQSPEERHRFRQQVALEMYLFCRRTLLGNDGIGCVARSRL